MPTPTIVWRGNEDDTNALIRAITRNCEAPCTPACTAHAIMRNQDMLDRLLFHRRIAHRLLAEEFKVPSPT